VSIGQGTRIGRLNIRVDRLVYTTITLISVLIIYDGWNRLTFWGVLAVILGPMLAIFLSHLFGAELGTRVALGRPLTWRERRAAFVEECRFLIVLVPPVLILIALSLAGVSYSRIVQVIILTGVASLGVWGLVASTAFGLLLGGFFLALQAVLQPGHYPFQG
jgi:hypothetical protein